MRTTSGRSLRATLRVLLTLVAATIAIGAAGFHATERVANPDVGSWQDSLWWAVVTLTTVGYGDIAPITAGGRMIATLLMAVGIGIVSVATATVAAYLVRFDPFEPLRARRLRDHVVVCGLGAEGHLLLHRFAERGDRVAVVELDEAHPALGEARALGAVVVVGDATEPDVLTRARVAVARDVIVTCGDDRVNAEVTARLRPFAKGRSTPLTGAVHIVDAHLWALLRQWELSGDSGLRLSFFHVADIAARAMLDAAALPPPEQGDPRRLLVVGSGRLARHLVLHAARDWWLAGRREPMQVTLFGEDADATTMGLHGTHPGLNDIVQIRAMEQAPDLSQMGAAFTINPPPTAADGAEDAGLKRPDHPDPATPSASTIPGAPATLDPSTPLPTPTTPGPSSTTPGPRSAAAGRAFTPGGAADAVFICLEHEPDAVTAALQVRAAFVARGRSAPIILRLDRDRGLGLLVRELDDSARADTTRPGGVEPPPLRTVGVLDEACRPELVLGGATELLARAAHAGYVAQQRALGVEAEAHRAMRPWPDLPETVREANRVQADDAVRKLSELGYEIGPLGDWSSLNLHFPEAHLDAMARQEHERWLSARRAAGWSVGPRNTERKQNPHLVPWDQLPESARETNRQAVRDLPRALFRAGLQIVRTPPPPVETDRV